MAEIQVEHLQNPPVIFVAVKNSSSTVANGTFFCLVGPSGCGKTTTSKDDRRPGTADCRACLARRRGRHISSCLGRDMPLFSSSSPSTRT